MDAIYLSLIAGAFMVLGFYVLASGRAWWTLNSGLWPPPLWPLLSIWLWRSCARRCC